MDPDAVWGGEWGRSSMDVLDGVVIIEREKGSFGVNLRRPIVTNGAFATRLFSNYFEDLLRFYCHVISCALARQGVRQGSAAAMESNACGNAVTRPVRPRSLIEDSSFARYAVLAYVTSMASVCLSVCLSLRPSVCNVGGL